MADGDDNALVRHRRTIAVLRQGVEDMKAGRLDVRRMDGESWRLATEAAIARDEAAIATLERLIDGSRVP